MENAHTKWLNLPKLYHSFADSIGPVEQVGVGSIEQASKTEDYKRSMVERNKDMARFTKGNKIQDETTEVAETPEAEVEVPETEEFPTEEESDFDAFLNSGELEIPSQGDNSAEAITSTQEEENEVAKHDTAPVEEVQEVQAEEVKEETPKSETELSDEAKRLMEEATPKAVEMKEISSIPPTLIHVSSNLMGIDALGKLIIDRTEAFKAGAGDKDAKVKYAVEHLTPEEDETHAAILEARANGTAEEGALSNYERRELMAELKKQIEELSARFDDEEAKLYEDVEAALTSKGEEIWSDAKIEEEKNYIADLHKNYASMWKNTADIMVMHNKVKPADKLGTIDQYVNKIDKPFSKSGGSTSSSGGATGSRNVFISVAEYSTDGGTNWLKVENSKGASNVAVLAAELAKVSKESQNELKDKIYSDYYADSDKTFETATNENMPPVATFKVNYQAKSGEFTDVMVRLTKRFQD